MPSGDTVRQSLVSTKDQCTVPWPLEAQVVFCAPTFGPVLSVRSWKTAGSCQKWFQSWFRPFYMLIMYILLFFNPAHNMTKNGLGKPRRFLKSFIYLDGKQISLLATCQFNQKIVSLLQILRPHLNCEFKHQPSTNYTLKFRESQTLGPQKHLFGNVPQKFCESYLICIPGYLLTMLGIQQKEIRLIRSLDNLLTETLQNYYGCL